MLVSAGNVKRDRIMKIKENMKMRGESNIDEASIAENLPEQEVCKNIVYSWFLEWFSVIFCIAFSAN